MRKEVTTYVEWHLDDDIKEKISGIVQLLNDVKAEAEQTGVGINIDGKLYTCENMKDITAFLDKLTHVEKIQVKQSYGM